jgi:internalin A
VSDGAVLDMLDLKGLSLETYAKEPIDFRLFHRLQRLAFNWRPGAETAFQCTSLESLNNSGYRLTDLSPMAALTGLRALRLDNSRHLLRLDGVRALPALRILSLRDDRALVDIGDVAAMDHSLHEFELNTCRKVRDIAALASHRDLRRVILIDNGTIASLTPLANLSKLEELYFYGTTVIEDGDMTPLLHLPALRRVAFAPRRHYSHRTEDIERLRGLTDSPPLPYWRWW